MKITVGIDRYPYPLCFLDGQEISDIVHAADDQEDWADCVIALPIGMMHRLHYKSGGYRGVVEERLYGKVEFKPRPEKKWS